MVGVRLARFRTHAGLGGVLRTVVVVALLVVGVPYASFVLDAWPLTAAVIVALAVPYLLRNRMADDPARWGAALSWTGRGLFVLVVTSPLWKSAAADVSERALLYGLSFLAALYISAYFWLLSDPRVVVEE